MKILSNLSSYSTSLFVLSISNYTFAQTSAGVEAPQQIAGNVSTQPAGAPPWVNFVLIAGIILFMWLFVFRPQSKRAKEQKEFLSSLSPGMEVITSGGIIGTILEVKDTIVSINLGSSTVRVLKSSISGKLDTATQKT